MCESGTKRTRESEKCGGRKRRENYREKERKRERESETEFSGKQREIGGLGKFFLRTLFPSSVE